MITTTPTVSERSTAQAAVEPKRPVHPHGLVNILLVDDDARNLDVLESILDVPDYRLVRAQSAEEALRALMVDDFAVIVLDIRMPAMDGLELAQLIKQRKKTQHIPIIFLTAYYQQDEHVIHGYGAGAVDYLNKPCNPAILRSKVAIFVDLFRKSHALQAEIDERKRLEAEIARVVEREQLRLGQELHDGLAQQLAGIGFMLAALQTSLEKVAPAGGMQMNRLKTMIEQSVEQARSLAKGFYPVELEKHGLRIALESIARKAEQTYKVACEVRSDESLTIDLKDQSAIQLFRIAQEAVHNAVKHAKAKRVVIDLTFSNGEIILKIQDDGIGLPPETAETKGMGLRIMLYRARMIGGTLSLRNGTNGGAVVTCLVPAANAFSTS